MIEASEILKETNPSGGQFSYTKDGDTAQMTWSRTSDTLVIASGTVVPDSMRGTGVAAALLARFVEDARTNGYKIMPLCPYVRAQSQRHKEWADVFTM